jgi:hypothetical protein
MNIQRLLEYFRHLPPSTQLAVIVGGLVILVSIALFPAAGTNIITFLLGLKMLLGR